MKTTQSRAFAGHLLCLGLPFVMMSPLRAELRETPLLLNRQGSFVEMEEGAFRRINSIETISGRIIYGYIKDGRSLKAGQLPLTPKGLAELKNLDRAGLEDAKCGIKVLININGTDHLLVLVSEEVDPIENWEPFAAAVNKAMEQMKKLLVVASPERNQRPRVIEAPKP